MRIKQLNDDNVIAEYTYKEFTQLLHPNWSEDEINNYIEEGKKRADDLERSILQQEQFNQHKQMMDEIKNKI